MTEQSYLDLTPLQFPSAKDLTIEEAFNAFHKANPHVYANLVSMARKLTRRGRSKIGMKMLFEAMRWNYQLQTDDPGSDFKLNNNYSSRYARLIASQEMDLADAFQTRELKTA